MLDRIQSGQGGQPAGGRLVVPAAQSEAESASFADLFANQLGASGIKVSAHAQQRLRNAEVTPQPTAADRLKSGIERAEQKGGKESLILVDDLAFVVSVANRTVITAVEGSRAKENVFTNIDSVVIG